MLQSRPMGDQRAGIQLSLLDQIHDLFTIAAIYSPCFKDQILSVHGRQGAAAGLLHT